MTPSLNAMRAVAHLAAQIDVRVSMAEPARDAPVNVLGSVNVFDAAQQACVRRVVSTSTGGAIYGVTAAVPISEDVCRPLSAPHFVVDVT